MRQSLNIWHPSVGRARVLLLVKGGVCTCLVIVTGEEASWCLREIVLLVIMKSRKRRGGDGEFGGNLAE